MSGWSRWRERHEAAKRAAKEPGDCGCPLWPKVGGDPREPIALRATKELPANSLPANSPPPDLTHWSGPTLVETPIDY